MSQAISVENVSKQYRIGAKVERARTLGEAVGTFITSPLRNLSNLKALTRFQEEIEDDVIWALRNVSFDVEEGEVVGIIGRNGAGKSTLLKVLSRITPPSHGRVHLKGRVSSLLEVGTGFHPELSGRENIYLNGTILGMRKGEVEKKFDEIVEFSGIQKFLDTPVKRYSSGMTVRLAFSVAAHLEPEVLMIDEVLAVGDQEFQDRCIGKMSEVASGGRTVLFVSHNLAAVKALCSRSILLEGGMLTCSGSTDDVIGEYLGEDKYSGIVELASGETFGEGSEVELKRIRIYQEECEKGTTDFVSTKMIFVEMEVLVHDLNRNLCIGFDLFDERGTLIFRSFHTDSDEREWPKLCLGSNVLQAVLNPIILNSGVYLIAPRIGIHNEKWIVNSEAVLKMSLLASHAKSRLWNAANSRSKPGCIAPILPWHGLSQ